MKGVKIFRRLIKNNSEMERARRITKNLMDNQKKLGALVALTTL